MKLSKPTWAEWLLSFAIAIAIFSMVFVSYDKISKTILSKEICFPYQVETFTEKAVFCNLLNGFEPRPWSEE